MKVLIICRSSDILNRFGNDRILPKNTRLKYKSTKTKNYVKNYARYTTLNNYFLWFTMGRMIVIEYQNKTLT